MNKKLMALPVACVVVAMLGASVMAAGSAQKAFKVEDENGEDITIEYDGTPISISGNEKLTDLDGIQDEIDAYNKEAKAEDAELVAAYYIDPVNVDHAGEKTVTFLGVDANDGDVFVVVHFDSVTGGVLPLILLSTFFVWRVIMFFIKYEYSNKIILNAGDNCIIECKECKNYKYTNKKKFPNTI